MVTGAVEHPVAADPCWPDRQRQLNKLKQLNPNTMLLLVPTDFSRNAEHAMLYAGGLAEALKCDIHLLHVITPFATRSSFLTVETDEVRITAIQHLQELRERLSLLHEIKCSFDVAIGSVPDQVIQCAKEKKADMIVMGTQGASGIKKFLFGSNTAEVVQHSDAPVLALPPEVEFHIPRRIVFATDYHSGDLNDLKEIALLAQPFNSTIKVVHIVNRFEEEEDDEQPVTVLEYFSHLMKKQVAYTNISCEEFQYTDVAEGIQVYAEDEHADLLAISVRQKTFLQRLFNRNFAKEFVFEIPLPLLVYHNNQDQEEIL
jgi:nucleotide-binding universal stress UspA family protein